MLARAMLETGVCVCVCLCVCVCVGLRVRLCARLRGSVSVRARRASRVVMQMGVMLETDSNGDVRRREDAYVSILHIDIDIFIYIYIQIPTGM